MPTSSKADFKSLKKILPYLLKYKMRASLALLSLIIAKLTNIGIPVIFKEIVDALDTNNSTANLMISVPIALLLGYGLLRASSALFNELRDSIFAKVRYHIMRQISIDLLAHMHKLSLNFHLNRQTGAITRDMERGVSSVNSLINLMLFNIIPTLVEILGIALILFFSYDILFVLITLATVILYAFFTMKITEWRIQFRVRMNAKDSDANNHALDSMLNFETVKYFGNEAHELTRYQTHLDEWAQAGIKSQTSMSALNFGQAFIIAIGVTAIMILAASGVADGTMSLGDLVLVNTFMLQLFIPLGFLGIVYSQIKHALSDIGLMFKLFEQRPEITDHPNAKTLHAETSDIQFERVTFGYDSKRPILKSCSFTVPNGAKVAIVGQSGAGKSTLSRLLFRFYDPQSGRITINGQDIKTLTQKSLRHAIGIVPQDIVLFNNTIAYNIQYARPDASESDTIHAAKQANIHAFINSLPDGYRTIVGERGLKLSGGEKQRVAIARAILSQPKILMFDEATSSLDSIAEQAILKELDAIAQNHTTLIIAHRLSTITDADMIFVLENGTIVEQGDHIKLLAMNGRYANLWHKQQKTKHI